MAGAWIDGKPVGLAAAAKAAARVLAASPLPVIAGLGTDIAGARAAIALAERIGGVVDHMHSEAVLRNLAVMRESGMMTTTANEARQRGELVLLVGPGLAETWPDLAARVLAPPLGPQAAERKRRVVWLCPGRERLDSVPVTAVGRDAADLPNLLAVLRARVNGRRAGKVRVNAKVLDTLIADLKAARFGVAVWSATALDEPSIEMLCGLVNDLNAGTRFTGLPLWPVDNAFGVVQACGWMTGFPVRTAFGRGYPEHDPWRFDAARLVQSGEADCLLYISAWERDVSALADSSLPLIALGRADTTVREHARVYLQVGRPALDHDAVTYCPAAGTLVHVKASQPSDAISTAGAIARIAAELPDGGAWPC
jgi:formylmethanofuran dehydrogenase subunit B